MKVSLTTKPKGTIERAQSSIEAIANNLYYSLTLNNYILKLETIPLPLRMTIDELMENDFIVGNLVAADAIIQHTQMISA
jgi:hypothetical protein